MTYFHSSALTGIIGWWPHYACCLHGFCYDITLTLLECYCFLVNTLLNAASTLEEYVITPPRTAFCITVGASCLHATSRTPSHASVYSEHPHLLSTVADSYPLFLPLAVCLCVYQDILPYGSLSLCVTISIFTTNKSIYTHGICFVLAYCLVLCASIHLFVWGLVCFELMRMFITFNFEW